MKACILIKTKPGSHDEVSKIVAELKGVKTCFAVLGRTDVVANIEVADIKILSALALKIGDLVDVVMTETLIAMEGV
jgi:uncharacterized protein with GYD domain